MERLAELLGAAFPRARDVTRTNGPRSAPICASGHVQDTLERTRVQRQEDTPVVGMLATLLRQNTLSRAIEGRTFLERSSTMLKAIDFFCGAGGMTHGLLRAGIDVLAGVDIHGPCALTYEYPGNNDRPSERAPTFLQEDITNLTSQDLQDRFELGDELEEMVLVGCSPCQYWSTINTSRSKAERTKTLLAEFGRLVDELRPGYVVVENVPGLARRAEEAGLSEFFELLRNAGFAVEHAVLRLREYGVPQKRHRFVLIATRVAREDSEPTISLPTCPHLAFDMNGGVNVRDWLGVENGFAEIPAGHEDDTDFMHTAAGLSERNLRRIRLTPKSGGSRAAWKDDPDLQIDAYRGKDDSFRDVYGRMTWDDPAPTITTRFHSLSNGRFGHPQEDRAISLREGATLQTFPTSYVFKGSQTEIARQIGNAVPPLLSEHIGRHIVEHWASSRTVP